jgi:hypothetical protein
MTAMKKTKATAMTMTMMTASIIAVLGSGDGSPPRGYYVAVALLQQGLGNNQPFI